MIDGGIGPKERMNHGEDPIGTGCARCTYVPDKGLDVEERLQSDFDRATW